MSEIGILPEIEKELDAVAKKLDSVLKNAGATNGNHVDYATKIEKLTKKRDDLQTKIKDLKAQRKDSSKSVEVVALRKEIKELKRKANKLKEATQLADNIETSELQKTKAEQEKAKLLEELDRVKRKYAKNEEKLQKFNKKMNLLNDVANDTEKYIELLEKQHEVVTKQAAEATQRNEAIREETSNLHQALDLQQQLNEERKRSKEAVSTSGFSEEGERLSELIRESRAQLKKMKSVLKQSKEDKLESVPVVKGLTHSQSVNDVSSLHQAKPTKPLRLSQTAPPEKDFETSSMISDDGRSVESDYISDRERSSSISARFSIGSQRTRSSGNLRKTVARKNSDEHDHDVNKTKKIRNFFGVDSSTDLGSVGRKNSTGNTAYHAYRDKQLQLHSQQDGQNYYDDTGLVVFSDKKKSIIKGGTNDKLIDTLCFKQYNPGDEYWRSFLMTYATFTTTAYVFERLLTVFQMEVKDPEAPIEPKKVPLVLKMWMEEFPYDFAKPDDTTSSKLNALLEAVEKAEGQEANAKALRQQLKVISSSPSNKLTMRRGRSNSSGIGGGNVEPPALENLPKPVTPKGNDFTDFDTDEVGRQMTLLEMAVYKSIQPKELLKGAWQNKQHKEVLAPNITLMIQRFNLVSRWVQTCIVQSDKIKDRVQYLKTFLKIASYCLDINNYNAAMTILSGLRSSAVGRLKKTWGKLEIEHNKWYKSFERLCSILDSGENYRVLRQKLIDIDPPNPCIPYLGTYLSDLNMVEEGNPNTLDKPELINFEKRRRAAFVINETLKWQQTEFKFAPEGKIQGFLNKIEALSDDDLFKLSLVCEPREDKKSRRPYGTVAVRGIKDQNDE